MPVMEASHLAAISIVYTGDERECVRRCAAAPRSSGREVERDGAISRDCVRDCVRDCPRYAESGASMPSLDGSSSSIGERSVWRERVSAASAWQASERVTKCAKTAPRSEAGLLSN
jgi:hypothetical protein